MSLQLLKVTIILGAILLVLLCWKDFKIEFKAYLREEPFTSYLAFFAFSVINILIYTLLCALFLEHDPITLLFKGLPSDQGTVTTAMIMQPLIISLMYFGSSAKKFKIEGQEVSLYSRLLDLAKNLLPHLPTVPLVGVQESLEGKREYERLFAGAMRLRQLSEIDEHKHWDSLDAEWEQKNLEPLRDELMELNKIENQINAGAELQDVENDVKTDIQELSQIMLAKLRDYLVQFVAGNGKTEADLNDIFKIIDINDVKVSARSSKGRNFAETWRLGVICFIIGILFGPVFAFFRNESLLTYAWIGGASLAVFGITLFFGTSKAKRLQGFLVGGATAGLVGHMLWSIFSGHISLDAQTVLNLTELQSLLFGIAYGAGTGFAYWFFLARIQPRKSSNVLKIIAGVMLGGITFSVVSILLLAPNFGVDPISDILGKVLMTAVIGMVVMFAVILSTEGMQSQYSQTASNEQRLHSE